MSDTSTVPTGGADKMLDAAIAEAEGAPPPTVVLAGQTFTLRQPVPMGALAVFASRVTGPDTPQAGIVRLGAAVKLAKAWIVESEHARLEDAIESVADLDAFLEEDIARLVEAGAARPT